MPEGLEAEIWRRSCASLVGRMIVDAVADERVSPAGLAMLLVGAEIEAVRRIGKVVLLDTTRDGMGRVTVGLHFGMTGRLVVDGAAAIEKLAYASGRDDAEWDRLLLWTHNVGEPPGRGGGAVPALRFNDPRRLGHVSIDADLTHLGVDFTAVTQQHLTSALGTRRVAIKTLLLDQHVVAGLGNLCVDEVLWWSAIDPHRSSDELGPDEVGRLAHAIRSRLAVMLHRGGSTTGVLDPVVRANCPPCRADGTPLQRGVIGGRTTVWCPSHQR